MIVIILSVCSSQFHCERPNTKNYQRKKKTKPQKMIVVLILYLYRKCYVISIPFHSLTAEQTVDNKKNLRIRCYKRDEKKEIHTQYENAEKQMFEDRTSQMENAFLQNSDIHVLNSLALCFTVCFEWKLNKKNVVFSIVWS